MTIEDYARSLLAEAGLTPPEPKAPDKDETTADETKRRPEPNKPDPEEVQYPGYFKGDGSL